MLKKVQSVKRQARHARFAIVASRYNATYVDAMLDAAGKEFRQAGAEVEIVRVPGAYEVPVVAAVLARSKRFSAIVCLGVIIRGETVHAQHIGDTVSRALMQIQLETEVPVIHEVLLLESKEQARARCMDSKHNRGTEAAQTALEMAVAMTRARRSP